MKCKKNGAHRQLRQVCCPGEFSHIGDLLYIKAKAQSVEQMMLYRYPIEFMYAISTHIWVVFMVNVGKYTIHGCYIGCGPPPDFGKVLVGIHLGRVQKTPKLIYPDAQCFFGLFTYIWVVLGGKSAIH